MGFLSTNSIFSYDDYSVIVRLFGCYRHIVKPYKRHAKFRWREAVEDGGKRPEIIVCIITEGNVVYSPSVCGHACVVLKSNHSRGDLSAFFFTIR